MKQIKIYLSISILINFAMICCGFLVGQFDGELVDGMKIDIRIGFIGAPDKYLLQAIDTKQNRFSIKTSKSFSNKNFELIIDYNGLTCNVSNYYGIFSDGIFDLLITFVFKQNNLYYRYNKYENELCLLNIQSVSDSNNNNNKQIIKTIDWADERDLQHMRNQTKIWFGYSNKIINNNNYDWSNNINNNNNNNNNQIIIGCIDYFIVNNNDQIKLEMKGDNFYYCTKQEVIKSICKNNNNQYGECRNRSIYQHILHCKNYGFVLSELNTANHCYRDLSNNNNVLHSYEQIGNDRKSIIVKLAWITKQSINQCLMEIITRNNSLIEIYLNSSNQIILAIKHDKLINWSKHILYEISSNQIHILRIKFAESDSTFEVSNGEFIKTLILPQLGLVKLINVGRNFRGNLCQKLATKYVFRYDSKQFRLLNEPNVRSWVIFYIVIIPVSCLILICIGWIICKVMKEKGKISTSTLNIDLEPIEMNK